VTWTEQDAPDNEHVVPVGKLIEPVPPFWEKVIVSLLMEPVYPETVAVQVCCEHITTVLVACLTARDVVPELAALRTSPGYDA